MTATTDDVDLHPCQCGDPDCQEMVRGKYARGHWAKAQARKRNLIPLPGPDDDLDDEDLPDELVAELDELDGLDWIDQPVKQETWSRRGKSDVFVNQETGEEVDFADPPASKIPPPRTRQAAGSKRPIRVTATVQRDVTAKIRMVTMPAAQMWAIRDDVCGPVAVQQEPEIAAAFAEIVCDSPDLLNWFTGTAGGYMKYFKLTMALWPVLMTVWLHHIAHAERAPQVDGQQPPQMANYAA